MSIPYVLAEIQLNDDDDALCRKVTQKSCITLLAIVTLFIVCNIPRTLLNIMDIWPTHETFGKYRILRGIAGLRPPTQGEESYFRAYSLNKICTKFSEQLSGPS